jgi:hypothetical protein
MSAPDVLQRLQDIGAPSRTIREKSLCIPALRCH